MKTLITDYLFSPNTKQITFNNISNIKLEEILLITNCTTNQIIYSFADPNAGGTVTSNIMTLDYDTTSMNQSDSLQIFIDTPNTDFTSLTELVQDGLIEIVRQLQSIKSSTSIPDTSGRTRVAIETGGVSVTSGTITTVTTVGTANNLAAIGGYSANQYLMSQSNAAWGNLRSKISIT